MAGNTSVNYVKWKKVILIIQFVIAGLILIAEIYGNTMLYVTRSQGYGPDTIVEKLLRYLVLTTCINFGAIFVGQMIVKATENVDIEKYALIIVTEILCFNSAFSHYQFAIVFSIFAVPIMLCILYEDKKLSNWALLLSTIGLFVSITARATDDLYNQDIAIEGVVAHIYIFCVFVVSRICLNTLAARRAELEAALVNAEKAKYLEQVEEMSLQMVEALASAIDAKDKYTNGHSFRVAEYSAIMATEMGWPKERVDALRYEALLHDIGKIGIPDSVLNKNGKLTEIEFNVIRSHTTIGADILKSITGLPGAKYVARSHHERYDGKGYPNGVSGREIPENARVVGLADAYDAMSSDRVYRAALKPEIIREELVKGKGTQFDPEYLEIFLKLLDEGKLKVKSPSERSGKTPREVPEAFIQDLHKYINEVTVQGDYQGAFSVKYQDFSTLFTYLKKLGERYGHSLEVVMILLKPNGTEEITESDMDTAADSMEIAVKKNIRTVDVCIKYSKTQFLAVMLDAGVGNMDTIMQRIFLDYFKLCGNRKLEPSYEVN